MLRLLSAFTFHIEHRVLFRLTYNSRCPERRIPVARHSRPTLRRYIVALGPVRRSTWPATMGACWDIEGTCQVVLSSVRAMFIS
jgi:hypothetical protein